jgi:uncharacterized repeat protein (TIGR01451 family)
MTRLARRRTLPVIAILVLAMLGLNGLPAVASGSAATLNPDPAVGINFGAENVASQSAPQTVTISSTGTSALTLNNISMGGAMPNAFIIQGTNCIFGPPGLQPNQSCNVSVAFTPSAPGAANALLVFSDDAANSPQTEPLSGTGTQPQVQITPNQVTFPDTAVGTQSAPLQVTVADVGNGSLSVNSVVIGQDPGDFRVQSDQCGGQTIAPNTSCAVSLVFSPASPGPHSGSLSVFDNAPASPQQAGLMGNGTAAFAQVQPASLSFGPQLAGTTSSSQAATLQNTGNAGLTINSILVNGPGFIIASNACPAMLPPNGVCTVQVSFSPPGPGTWAGQLIFNDSAFNNPNQAIPLSGNGVAAQGSAAPQGLGFGSVVVGTSSGTQQVTIGSTGSYPLTIQSVTLAGANTADFVLSSDMCSGATLNPGQSCTFSVAFAPTAPGTRSADVNVTSNSFNPIASVGLSGTGLLQADLSVSISANPNPAPVAGTLTYTVSVANAGPGAAGSVVVTDSLPNNSLIPLAQITYSSSSASQGSCGYNTNTRVVTCNLGTIAAGQGATVTINLNVLALPLATLTDTASVSSATPDPNPSNNTATDHDPVLI